MSSDVVLTAALRNNLLSLQSTQNLIDQTQLRLATGLKVNSALDSPANFFAAQSLDNRANDLNRLLDGVSQSIRTIEEADNGITALTNLVEQAQSIASSARDELASSTGEARLIGNVDLSTVDDLGADLTGITDGDQIVISTVNDSGTKITETITIADGDSGKTLVAKITNAFSDNRESEISARLTDDGFLEISSTNGRSFRVTTDETNEIALAGFTDLGIGDSFALETRGTAAADAAELVATTVIAGNTATSISLNESSGDVAEAGDLLVGTSYLDNDANTVISALAAGDVIDIDINDGTGTTKTSSFTLTATSTFQDLVDSINQDADTKDLVEANFDSGIGTFSITSTSDKVKSVKIELTDTLTATDAQFDLSFGDTTGNLDAPGAIGAVDADRIDTTISFNTSTESLDALAADYNSLRTQIDTLVDDAQYRGVNLLNGDDLTTFFNEDNTSTLTTSGATFTANGLGLTEATFRSSSAIELSATQSRNALGSVRSFGSSLANNLSIIQTREDFTKATINTLKAGADDLTVADQNEEGANLLALQTRQTLGVTSLSLASQSQQAVLRLF